MFRSGIRYVKLPAPSAERQVFPVPEVKAVQFALVRVYSMAGFSYFSFDFRRCGKMYRADGLVRGFFGSSLNLSELFL